MAFTPFNGSGGGGASSSECTGSKVQALAGYTFITSDSDDEAVQGTIATRSDSGDTVLKSGTTSKSYASGYYPNAHGAKINAQTKTATPSASQQTISPDSGYVLTGVTVNAIGNQTAGGSVKLTASSPNATRNSGVYLTSAFTVSVDVFSW